MTILNKQTEESIKKIRKIASRFPTWSCEMPSGYQYVEISSHDPSNNWFATVQLVHHGKPTNEIFDPNRHEHYYTMLIKDRKYQDGTGGKRDIVLSIKAEPTSLYYSVLKSIFEVNLAEAFTPPLRENGSGEVFSKKFIEIVSDP
jgi:hypothetical protein